MPAASVQLPPQQITRHSLRRLARYRISTHNQKQLQQQKLVEKHQHQHNESDSILLLPSTSTSSLNHLKQNVCVLTNFYC